jgi:putative transposase
MEITITAKIKLNPTSEQASLLKRTASAYSAGCNHVSSVAFADNDLKQRSLHNKLYPSLRSEYGLMSQMACSVIKTVLARYKSAKSNGHDFSLVKFRKPGNKKLHLFACKTCNYRSNDDRIGAMNLQRKGIEYIVEVAALA